MRKFYLDYWNEKLLHLGGKDGSGGIAYLLSAMSIQTIAGIISLGPAWIHRKESFQGEHYFK